MGRLLEQFERELDREVAGESGTWKDLLYAQVAAIEDWVRGAPKIRLYHAGAGRVPFPTVQVPERV